MSRGTVKWYNQDKGYGLITPDDGSTELLVTHATVAEAGLYYLWQGDRVQYEAGFGLHGPKASRIELLPLPRRR